MKCKAQPLLTSVKVLSPLYQLVHWTKKSKRPAKLVVMLLKPTLIEFNVLISVPVDHVKLHWNIHKKLALPLYQETALNFEGKILLWQNESDLEH